MSERTQDLSFIPIEHSIKSNFNLEEYIPLGETSRDPGLNDAE